MTPLVEPDWHAARQAAAALGRPVTVERIPLADADRRVLGASVSALVDLPGFDTSAMDGWAVSGRGPWQVVGEVLAGRPGPGHVAGGECVAIATGAAVPAGADGIVRREVGTVTDGVLHCADEQPAASDIRPRGEECRRGELLAAAGQVVNPALIGMLAAAGHDTVAVFRRPRIRLLLLGDELVKSGLPGPGSVRDSLGPQLPGWVARLGGHLVSSDFVADTLAALTAALDAATSDADLVITTGGTAAGPVDHLHPALAAAGADLVVDSVAVRPGHPMLLATGRCPVVGLPGNPQSAVIGLLTLAAPLLATMTGRDPGPVGTITSTVDLPGRRRDTNLVAGRLSGGFVPAGHLGSAMLRGLAGAEGFAVVPPGGRPAGSHVGWLPFPD